VAEGSRQRGTVVRADAGSGEPGGPGPFSLAEPDRIRSLLEGVGLAEDAVPLATWLAPLTRVVRGVRGFLLDRRRLHARVASAEVAEQADLGAVVDVLDGDA
jgi:hypothetical protein